MRLEFDYAEKDLGNEKLFETLKKYKDIILFGAGNSGSYFLEKLRENDIDARCFCDNYSGKIGTEKMGLPIFSFEEAIKRYPESAICISSVFVDPIIKQITDYNSSLKNQIHIVMKTMNWETATKSTTSNELEFIRKHLSEFEKVSEVFQDLESKKVLESILNFRLTRDFKHIDKIVSSEDVYFDRSILNMCDKKSLSSFLDGGSFNGDTLPGYLELLSDMGIDKPDSIYCFEPDKLAFSYLKDYTEKLEHQCIKLFNAGLYIRNEKISFNISGSTGGKISDESKDFIEVFSVDQLGLTDIGFVKLDIEGSEKEALMGMRGLIESNKPILAVCAYHLQDDLIEIPKLIRRLNKSYKLYLRHYMHTPFDTVIYAI